MSAQRVLRTSMELGGNAPLIVFNDANLERVCASPHMTAALPSYPQIAGSTQSCAACEEAAT